ncbi:MAG: trypsin-like peptidase domain-containing protein [Candidatus Uhrbacteria bacterium]
MENKQSTTLIVLLAITVLISTSFGVLGGFLANQYFSLSGRLFSVSDQVDKNIIQMIEEESSAISVVDRVTPAVVSIVIKKKAKDVQTNSMNLFFFGQEAPVEPKIEDPDKLVEVGAGTGFFVTSDGYVVTNRHVVEEEDAFFTVVTLDDKEYEAKVVDIDPFFDIAILKIEGANFPTVVFGDADNLEVGQTVIAIGNALSQYQNTVTKGVISGVNRRLETYDNLSGGEVIEGAIQTDAAINLGNSGGPLINLLGEVIGMNTAVSSDGQGLGFAIPVNEIKQAIESVKKDGRIIRPWLGVRFLMINKEYAEAESLPVEVGALISADEGDEAIVKDGPADKAGLKTGDVVTKVDGEILTEENSLSKVVREHLSGDVLKLTVLRGEETLELLVTLEEYKEE